MNCYKTQQSAGFVKKIEKNRPQSTGFMCTTVCQTEIDTDPKNMLLLKNPQFLRNQYETWSKCAFILIA